MPPINSQLRTTSQLMLERTPFRRMAFSPTRVVKFSVRVYQDMYRIPAITGAVLLREQTRLYFMPDSGGALTRMHGGSRLIAVDHVRKAHAVRERQREISGGRGGKRQVQRGECAAGRARR